MIGETAFFVFSLIDTGALLFLSVYMVVTLSDLECDYLNAPQCCSKLNKWVLPELVASTTLTLLLLLTNHWILFLLSSPMTAWLIYKMQKRPKGSLGHYDATEIHNRGNLQAHTRDAIIRLAFHLVHFFIYLYSMIIALLTKG